MREWSEGERNILRLLANGYETKEIAIELGRSFYTIRHYKERILMKFRALNSPHAVAIGFCKGIIKRDDIVME